MAGNITLKELAALLNVSVSTISKALNDSHEISEATKKRIKEAAELHHYEPNKIALGLKSGKTNTIGVILPSVQNPFFARVLYGIEQIIAESKYNIVVCITNESYEKEVENIKVLSNGLVDGFIIAVSEGTQIKQRFNHFIDALGRKKPMVMFDRVVDSIHCDKVIIDDFEAVYNATNEILKTGRKNIALATTISNVSVAKQRIKGYAQALTEKFGAVDDSIVVTTTPSEVKETMVDFIKNNPQVDAIISLDVESSYATHKACRINNKNVPLEIALVGYLSETIAENLNPELTTIDQHRKTIGMSAANLLIKKLNSKGPIPAEEVHISSSLKRRATF